MENAALGKRLKEARLKKKLTQEQLAEKADISAIYLSELERGEKSPSMTVFVNLVLALDISADYLLLDELPSGMDHVNNEISQRLNKLTPKQRASALAILDAYIKSL